MAISKPLGLQSPDHQFPVKIVKVSGFEEGSDGSSLCNCCEVPTHVAERIGLVEASSTF